ncbi:NAD-dependent dehydratase [bacterium]|nr:NAD-dependent dehydratase [bacterium]
MQTILGSTGAIGKLLAKELTNYTHDIRLVSRNPVKVNDGDSLFKADLLNKDQVSEAVKDSEVVYLTAGLQYNIKIWRQQWPVIMRNVIDACLEHDAKFVFFDNIYMISKEHFNNITEESPINPCSRKGEIRAQLDNMILDEMKNGNLNAIIARAADFYGKGSERVSILYQMVIDNVRKGKKAQWFIDSSKKHSFTFTPDAAKAVAILGNTPDAFNQIWNLPTAQAISGEEMINLVASLIQKNIKHQVMPLFVLKGLSVFVPVLKEFVELAYQWDRDYILNSSKFEKRFNFVPTSLGDGVKQILS